MMTAALVLRLLLAAMLAAAIVPTRSAAAESIRAVAERIAGGAALMRDLDDEPSFDVFYDRARQFADLTRGAIGPADLDVEWRRLRAAYRAARKSSRRSRDEGWRFLSTHLDEDFAAGARLLGSAGGGPGPSAGAPRRLSLIRNETCFGRAKTEHECPNRRESLSFALPRDVGVIRRVDTEWRDFGADANGEIYLNDRLVWRQDVRKDWDGDGKQLNVRVPAGSILTIRSANGDPIWIRKLTIDVVETSDRETDRDSWELPDPWR